jgi:hypothetical protein
MLPPVGKDLLCGDPNRLSITNPRDTAVKFLIPGLRRARVFWLKRPQKCVGYFCSLRLAECA